MAVALAAWMVYRMVEVKGEKTAVWKGSLRAEHWDVKKVASLDGWKAVKLDGWKAVLMAGQRVCWMVDQKV